MSITSTTTQTVKVYHLSLQDPIEDSQSSKSSIECVRELLEKMKACPLFSTEKIASFLQIWEETFLSSFENLDSEEAKKKACDALALLWIEALSPACPKFTQLSEAGRASLKTTIPEWTSRKKDLETLLKKYLPQGLLVEDFISRFRAADRTDFIYRKKLEVINAIFHKLAHNFNHKVNLTYREFQDDIARLKQQLRLFNAFSEHIIDEYSDKVNALSELVDRAIEKLNSLHREEEEDVLLEVIADEKDFQANLQGCEDLMKKILKI